MTALKNTQEPQMPNIQSIMYDRIMNQSKIYDNSVLIKLIKDFDLYLYNMVDKTLKPNTELVCMDDNYYIAIYSNFEDEEPILGYQTYQTEDPHINKIIKIIENLTTILRTT